MGSKIKLLANVIERSRYIAVCLVMLASSLAWIHIVNAEQDITPMVLTHLEASTNAINVDNGEEVVHITSPAYDNLSGIQRVDFYYTSPSGNIVYEGDTGFSGENQDLFDSWVRFPQYTEAGIWRPTFITIDEAGNREVLDADELIARGHNIDITVASNTPDLNTPTITALDIEDSAIDIDAGESATIITAHINDAHISYYNMHLQFVAPNGGRSIQSALYYTGVDDIYQARVEFDVYSEGGPWSLYLSLCDQIGNCSSLDKSDLQSLGLPSEVIVTNTNGDTSPLSINSLSVVAGDPTFDNVQIGGGGISVLSDLSDDLSGVNQAYIRYYSQTTTQIADYYGMTPGPNATEWYLNALLPPYAAMGLWLPEIYTVDNANNRKTYSHADLMALGYDLSFSLSQTETGAVVEGGSITTDTQETGATPTVPVQTSLTSPVAGDVSITTLDLTQDVETSNGYLLAGKQIQIHAPAASAEEPLTLTFTLDDSEIPAGQDAATAVIFRNGVLIENCVDSTTANPDPCIFSRVDLPDGDIELKVHAIYASIWTMAFPAPENTLFDQFLDPISNDLSVNTSQAGSAIPVKFQFGDNNDLSVLSIDSVLSESIDCSTKTPLGDAAPISVIGGGLKLSDQNYRLNWKTLKTWKNSCRQLTLNFANGESAKAYFSFSE